MEVVQKKRFRGLTFAIVKDQHFRVGGYKGDVLDMSEIERKVLPETRNESS
jgi:hypothetical protein